MEMQGAIQGNNQSALLETRPTEPWTKFYLYFIGNTNGAHGDIVTVLLHMRQREVSSPGESDYVVVFYPTESPVGTDINRALEHIPVGKPTILMVLHLNHDAKQVANSSELVDNPNVHLTVDYLIRKGKVRNCYHNKASWAEVIKFIFESYREQAIKD